MLTTDIRIDFNFCQNMIKRPEEMLDNSSNYSYFSFQMAVLLLPSDKYTIFCMIEVLHSTADKRNVRTLNNCKNIIFSSSRYVNKGFSPQPN